MTRAEERALEAYPELLSGSIFGPLPVDLNKACREKYQEGYEQAEKDIKEQMTKGAVEGEVVQDIKGRFHIKTNAVSDILYHFGDKVKVLIIPEKCQNS